MTNAKKLLALIPTIILFLIYGSLHSGCNSVDEAYLTRVDTLDQMLESNEKYLLIDYKTIDQRKNLIFTHMSLVKRFYDKTMSEEFGNSMARYKGIYKQYNNFVNQYPGLSDELNELKHQAATLRESVQKKELSKEEFKQYYQKEKLDIKNNLAASEVLSQNIHGLEPDYQRISALIDSELVRIAQKNEDLKAILEAK